MEKKPAYKLFAFLVLPFCFFYFPISAQIVLDTGTLDTRTISCSSTTSFTDDNTSSGGLYFDENARKDSVIICPNPSGRQVKAVFNAFDVANGDLLTVFDGDITQNAGAPSQSASGIGVSSAFGGWVAANCDPAINPTGCLTFVFETNGDNVKGTGWQASLTCENSSTTVTCPSDISITDDCQNLDGMVTVTIPKPTFTTCGGTANAMVNITTNCTDIPNQVVLADGGTLGTFTIPLGTYTITATATADNSKTCTYRVFASQPNITCNDNLTTSIGFGCRVGIGVDDIIENPCVGSGTTYTLRIDLGSKGGTRTVNVDGTSSSTLNNTLLELDTDDFNCGDEYEVEVTRRVNFSGCGNGNSVAISCSGRVRFVDNTNPTVSISAPTLTTCGNLTDSEIKSQLTINVSDNCSVRDTIVSVGNFPSNFCAANLSVPVTITAVDFCGNSTTETFAIAITRPTDFFRPRDTVLTCGSGFGPEIAGYPLLDTDGDMIGDLPIIDNTCNFIATFSDQEVSAGNSQTIKIFRTWQIKDWCDQAVPITLDPQLIEIRDTGKPSINCPSGSQQGTVNNPRIVLANGSDCSGAINFPAPSASDDCGGMVTVSLDAVVNILHNTKFTNTTDLPVGQYFAVYFGRDDSGNRSDSCKVFFDVRDSNAPQAVCVDALNVSFVNNIATVNVADIDGGSADNCGPISKEIRKEGGAWGQSVSLTCEEVNNDGRVFLRVTDSNGAQNTCTVQITGKDSTVPTCGDLANQTLKCEEIHLADFGASTDVNDNKDFDEDEWRELTGDLLIRYNQIFGNPDCSDNLACGTALIEQEYQLVNALCGGAKILRRYRATDGGNNQSSWKEQLITLTTEENFSVTFPADWEGTCGDNFPEANLEVSTGGCNILAWTYEDRQFEGINGACIKIERTYSVTNWCSLQAGIAAIEISRVEDDQGSSNGQTVTDETLSNVGIFEYVQVLSVIDSEAPSISLSPVDNCINSENCTAQKTFSITASDCLGADGLSYAYEFMLGNNVLEMGQTAAFSAFVEPNSYTIKWTVNDNCGNTASLTQTYDFNDCTSPSPICFDGLAITVGEDGAALVWATDLNQKSFDNCSAEENLILRVYHPVLASDGFSKPQPGDERADILALPASVELTCDYLGNQEIELYVIDESGNWNYCEASVFVQDGSGVCGNGLLDSTNVAMVAGGVLAGNNIPLSGVTVRAKGTTFFEKSTITNESGIFELALPKDIGYIIDFSKPDDPANGLSTFDLILVSKHILGIDSFDEFWQHLAADINKSGTITAFDLVIMRKIILGIDSEIYAENPWRFLPASGEFSIEEDGMRLEEGIVIPALTKDLPTLDYFAIKMGDLNNTVHVDGVLQAEDRVKTVVPIHLIDQNIKAGDLVTLPIQVANMDKWQGLQFGLNFSGMTLEKVENGRGQDKHNYQKSPHEILIAWDKYSSVTNRETELFTLYLRAEQSGKLSELLQLSNGLATEAVDIQDNIGSIELAFKQPLPTNFQLYQNTPNPFSASTKISFELSEAGPIQLEIFNVQGQLIQQINGKYTIGIHEIIIEKTALPETGVFWYQLTTSNGVSAKKMIALD